MTESKNNYTTIAQSRDEEYQVTVTIPGWVLAVFLDTSAATDVDPAKVMEGHLIAIADEAIHEQLEFIFKQPLAVRAMMASLVYPVVKQANAPIEDGDVTHAEFMTRDRIASAASAGAAFAFEDMLERWESGDLTSPEPREDTEAEPGEGRTVAPF